MAAAENHLIEGLPKPMRHRLLAVCEPVELVFNTVLLVGRKPAAHAYFPIDGFVSLLTLLDGKPALEVGMVGREGMLGSHLTLGVAVSPMQALVQGAGTAWRIGADDLQSELNASSALRNCIYRYLYVLTSQMASFAACLRFHSIEPRLARWLLMSQDRAHSERFHVTQEFLALMLGVCRVGVTAAATELSRRGLIE